MLQKQRRCKSRERIDFFPINAEYKRFPAWKVAIQCTGPYAGLLCYRVQGGVRLSGERIARYFENPVLVRLRVCSQNVRCHAP